MLDLALDGRLFLSDPLDCAIQELDMLFSTENTELIGDPNFGVNFDQFLWQTVPSPSQVESYIREKIVMYTFFCRQLEMSIDVSTIQGTIHDIYLVKIHIVYDDKERTKTYCFN